VLHAREAAGFPANFMIFFQVSTVSDKLEI
jgi:hypothetical protein